MPFILRVVIVRVGGGCIGGGELVGIVVGGLTGEAGGADCWFVDEDGWSVMVGCGDWLCVAGGGV